MSPIAIFEDVWLRCAHLSALHAYLERNVSGVLKPEELLRSEWVARVSALDLYVHELVAQRMVGIFEERFPVTSAYSEFRISNEVLKRIRTATSTTHASFAFDLEVRRQLSIQSFQHPEKVASAIRLCSAVELWGEVAKHNGASEQEKVSVAKSMKASLAAIAERRNKIAHEGDLQPCIPRVPWPISRDDLVLVATSIEQVVRSIDFVVNSS